jgi:hypothetical protein
MTIITEIREQLGRADGVAAEAMAELATRYASEVGVVNERLAECGSLLRKGLRSEAIQLSKLKPDLNERAVELDFAEFDEWCDILQFYEIDVPPPLHRENADQLQVAFVDEQPIEKLMQQHRRLAIGRAPLAWRLRVLRAIAAAEPTNVMWVEDVEQWERSRIREIQAEAIGITKSRDLNAALRLRQEVFHSDWRIALSSEAKDKIADCIDRVEFESQSKQLADLGEKLYTALSEFDVRTGRAVREQWDRLVSRMKSPPPTDICQNAEPALEWLRQQDAEAEEQKRFADAMLALNACLDEGNSILNINRAYQAVVGGESEIAPAIESRYRAVVSELQLRSRRRTLISGLAIVMLTSLLVVAFIGWQWQNVRNNEIASASESLQSFLADDSFEEAERFSANIQQDKPYVFASPDFARLVSQLDARLVEETERVSSFERYLAAAKNNDPSQIDMGSLNKAESIARTEPEKAIAYEIRRQREEYDLAIQREQSEQLQNGLAAISDAFATLKAMPYEQVNPETLGKMLTSVDDVGSRFPRAGSSARQVQKMLRKRIADFQTSVRAERSRRDALVYAEQSLDNANSLPAFQKALTGYIESNPNAPLAGEFKLALAEQPHWEKRFDWNAFAKVLLMFVKTPDSLSAGNSRTVYLGLSDSLDTSDILSELPELPEYLIRASKRSELLESAVSSLDSAVIKNIVTLRFMDDEQQKRLFVHSEVLTPDTKKRIVDGNPTGLDTIVDSDGSVSNKNFGEGTTIIDQPKDAIATLLTNFESKSTAIEKAWERALLLDVKRLAEDEKEVPVPFRVILISLVLDTAIDGSPAIENDLADLKSKIAGRLPQSLFWYQETEVETSFSEEFLTTIRTSLRDAYSSYSAFAARLNVAGNSKLEWVGSIRRDANGNSFVHFASQPTSAARLFVLIQSPADPSQTLIARIGSVTGTEGNVELIGTPDQLIAGRPVFATPDL